MRIARKFTLVCLSSSLIPLAFFGAGMWRDTRKTLREASFQIQRGLARRTADRISARFDEATAALASAKTFLENRRGTLDPRLVLENAMTHYPYFSDVSVYDARGRETAAVSRFGGSRGPLFPNAGAVSDALRRQGTYVGSPEPEPDSPGFIRCAVPIQGKNGGMEGFLAARVSLQFLEDALRGLDLGEGTVARVTDGTGRPLAVTPKKGSEQWTPPAAALRPGWSEGDYPNDDGRPTLSARADLPDFGGYLFLERPRAIALAMAGAIRRQLTLLFAVAALLGLGASTYFGRRVARPLEGLLAVVRRMKDGRFDSLIEVKSRDEVGAIAESLREAQPALERRVRDSVLGRMARLIGHDIRQPLQALRNSFDMLFLKVSEDPAMKRHAALCYETFDWLDDFVEDILTVGRDRPLSARPLNVNELVKETASRMKLETDPAVAVAEGGGLPLCRVDLKEARKALANAVQNAREAVAGRGRVRISTAAHEAGAQITVADDGPGIPPEKMARLFDEFTTRESGTGLGLLVMKRVMDRHGGRLEIESPPGRGTTVRLIFPRVEP